jgi:hypothetical protein
VSDTHAPVIDCSTVRLLSSLAFDNNRKCFIGTYHLLSQKLKQKKKLMSSFPKSFQEDLFPCFQRRNNCTVLCVGVGGDRIHAARPGDSEAGYTSLCQLG